MQRYPVCSLCLLLVVILGSLYVANGDQIPVVPHDQLDDQVPCYKMAAEHWGMPFYDEFMGGQSASAMPVSVPSMLLFYLVFPPRLAFSTNLLCVMIVSYLSLYAALRIMTVRDGVAALVSLSYALLPFYSVYGLSSMGVPLVLCAVLLGVKRNKRMVPVILCLIYASCSSLVWVGFAVCFSLIVVALCYCARKMWKQCGRILLLCSVLVGAYLVFNVGLLSAVLGTMTESHRAEFVLNIEPFSLGQVYDFFLQGYYHSVSNHYYLAVVDMAVVAFGGIWVLIQRFHKQEVHADLRRLLTGVAIGLMIAFAIALFKVAFSSAPAIEIRSLLPGSLRSFQFDRFYWLYPCVWYVTTALALELLMRMGGRKGLSLLAWALVLGVVALTLNISAKENVVMSNARATISGQEPSQITWEEFYAEDLFGEIKADLDRESGGGSYRVISVGMHPAVALYNGLSTLDGYSTSYPLAYKHEFARIIEGELEKSDLLYSYYWGWGNRCYAFSHELGQKYIIPKNSGLSLEEFSMDVSALKSMGGDYIISAVPIEDYAQNGLDKVGCYRSDESYYEIWIYKVR